MQRISRNEWDCAKGRVVVCDKWRNGRQTHHQICLWTQPRQGMGYYGVVDIETLREIPFGRLDLAWEMAEAIAIEYDREEEVS